MRIRTLKDSKIVHQFQKANQRNIIKKLTNLQQLVIKQNKNICLQISFKNINQMKIFLLILFLVFGAFAETDNQQKNDEKDVIILDDKNLMSMIYESQYPWLLDLYAPWCGHCMKMASDWSKLATNLKGLVKVAKIDASKYPQFNEMYGLNGYPHIVFIPGGPKDKQNFYVHKGPRTAQALQFWTFQKIAEHKRTILEELTDRKKWNQVCIGPHSDFCVLFFLPRITQSESEQERNFYLKIISGVIKNFNRQPVSFLWTQVGDHSTLQKQFKLGEQLPSVVLINPNNKRFSVMTKSFTQDDFQNWLRNILDIQFSEIQGDFIFGSQPNKDQIDQKNNSNTEL